MLYLPILRRSRSPGQIRAPWRGVRSAAFWLFLPAGTVVAHGGPLFRRVNWTDWNWDPVVFVVLAMISWTYFRGLKRVWDRAGPGRVVGPWHAASFAAGMLMLFVALVSPLDPLSDQLSSAHMIQHMILMTVAAPLIVAGAPSCILLWGLALRSRQALACLWSRFPAGRIGSRMLWQPLVSWSLYSLVTWAWHMPALYMMALRNPFVHDLQHVTFFVTACLYWRVLLDPISRFRIPGAFGAIYLFGTTLQATILGVLMTLSVTSWYSDYEGRSVLWGLTALEDQQLAGLIMWMPACLPYVLVAAALIARMLVDLDKPTRPPVATPIESAILGGDASHRGHSLFGALTRRESPRSPLTGDKPMSFNVYTLGRHAGGPIIVVAVVVLWIYSRATDRDNADNHPHSTGAHGGVIVSLARDRYHVEAIVERGGVLRLYTLGQTETEVMDVPEQPLTAYVSDADYDAISFPLSPLRQAGDAPGKTSQFVGQLPPQFIGKAFRATIPNLAIGPSRHRIGFSWTANIHQDPMPDKLGDDAERALYMAPGGSYTASDIAANGHVVPSQKFRGFRAKHDFTPQPGDRLCPISRTKANPDCSWIIDGRRYEFCCPPCIDEFVARAKERPEELQHPEAFIATGDAEG